jgi:predicted permease
MTWIRLVIARVRGLLRGDAIEQDIDLELRSHIELATEAHIASGLAPDEARRRAVRSFGHLESVKEAARDVRKGGLLDVLAQDLRVGARMLRRNPAFLLVAVLSLALGIGANTAIFSIVQAVLLRSLPVPNPQELRIVEWSGVDLKTGNFTGSMRPMEEERDTKTEWLRVGGPAGRRSIANAFTFPLYTSLRERCSAQADLFGYTELWGVTVRGRGEPFISRGMMVSASLFPALGVRPALGQFFTAQDDHPGGPPVVVMTYGWWQRLFQLDPGILGETLTLNGRSYTVVGVLPRGFNGPQLAAEYEFYVPLSAHAHLFSHFSRTDPNHWWFKLMARVRPGVPDADFRRVLDVAFAATAGSYMKEPRVEITSGRAGTAFQRDSYRKPLLILLGIVGTVLLVACANLAGLSLARGAARRHELAVRAALGASRWRLVRQSLAESGLLVLLGSALGMLLAFWGKTAISRLLAGSPDGLHYDFSMNFQVLAFTAGAALLAALLAGLFPALRAGGVDPTGGLKDRAALGAPRLRAGRLLVAVQIALCLLLVVGAGLYGRTLLALTHIDPGFTIDNLLLFKVQPDPEERRGPAIGAFYEDVRDAVSRLPGVRSAALTQYKLLAGMMSGGGFFRLPSRPELDDRHPQAHRLTVSEHFFGTMEIPILLGRGFGADDTETSAKAVIVNESFVRSYLPEQHPVGQRLTVNKETWEIVGVCRDTKYTDIKRDVPPTVYFSYRQDRLFGAYVAVRTSGNPLALMPAIRKAVAGVDSRVPVSDVTTQTAVRDQAISQEILFATLCAGLAGLAVLLACIGLYGLMAYNVSCRTTEIGIRMSLGATRRDVAWPIVRDAAGLTLIGLGVGLPLAFGLARVVRSQLFGVEPADPWTMGSAVVVLVAVACVAAWLPARRAARINPMVALRAE